MKWALAGLGLLTACSSAGGRDAGNPDTVTPVDVSQWEGLVDAGTLRFLEEIGKSKRCEAADLDGDGVRELLCLRSEDGTQTWIKEGNGGPLEYKIERFIDGRVRYTYWFQTSGQPDLVDEHFPDGRRVMLFDANVDRKFERRLEEEPDGGDIVATESVDAGPQGFAVSRRWVRPAASDQGAGTCDGVSNFPSETGWWQGGGSAQFSEAPGVKCTGPERSRIGAAFECAKTRLDCLGRTNEQVKKQVEAHLADDDFTYGCNNPCINSNATTIPSSVGGKSRTNFNRNLLAILTPDQLCSTVLHEMLHTAGLELGDSHGAGTDQVYACARLCSHCIKYGGQFGGANEPPFPPESTDCVRCAGTEAEKRRCGEKVSIKDGACSTNNYCHAGLGNNAPCQTCEVQVTENCEGTPTGTEIFNCCKMCPPGIDHTNDYACPRFMPRDGCAMPPPHCKY